MDERATNLPLVLLPGLLCDEAVWAPQQAALVAQGVPVETGSYGTIDRIESMARYMLAQVAAPRFALAGHSMGGRVALEMVRQAPGRIAGLALLDTGTAALAPGAAGEQERQGRLELLALAERDGMEAMARRWVPPMVHPDVCGTPLFERIVAMVARSDTRRFAAQIHALLERPDAEPVLRGLHCPLLLVCGKQDQWSPPERHEAMQEMVPDAMLRLVDHCGHMSPMEQPQAVATALLHWFEDFRHDG
ncbi:alpha/beta fold hydrolase [Paracidovorax wautersii]|uniref:Pimeloyl-ACP methyl ester carboxylesterase n=1 Tax=Paracidovorax wautersii TaxID=1177982 RepID=A0A1I2HAZ6_9BURK|nr:alpha/beta hydrolase [Paracidovorax wautersii]SFF26822.1 Pimeloyl-ACP methyl ester carboxylesterase [Paracidovorax wautersii]